MKLPIMIIGAGGHAASVADALLAAGERVLGLLDPDASLHGRIVCGVTVLGDDQVLAGHSASSLALANGIGAVGSVLVRRGAQQRLQALGWHFVTVRHPHAIVSPFAHIGEGVQLMAASVVQPGAEIGVGSIINTGAVVEHDVRIGAWAHVAPGAVLCGDVVVGTGSHIGAGATVRQGLHLGEETVVGAGAVVVTDFAGPGTLVGVPARQAGGAT